jgi:hypothetical protein
VAFGEEGNDIRADVVAAAGVLAARVSQPDDQQIGGQALPLGLAAAAAAVA